MTTSTLLRSSLAEFFGTALLVCVVVGSGIMGTELSSDLGIALLINTFSTVFALALIIFILAPLSGAHLNPAVTLVMAMRKEVTGKTALSYTGAQICGAIVGAIVANIMFDQAAVSFSQSDRVSPGLWLGELLATAGLITLIVVLVDRKQTGFIPVVVAAWIGSAYFFTSSTSFANPAVTIGRVFSDTFAGISGESVPFFVSAQLVGALIGLAVAKTLHKATPSEASHQDE